MPSCAAYGCTNRTGCKKDSSKFPKDATRCMQWVVKLKRDKFKPSAYSTICAEHFEDSCFDRTGQIVRLKPDAVPTIFQFPQHLINTSKKRKAPAHRVIQEDQQYIEDECPISPPQKNKKIEEHNYSTCTPESPRKLTKKWQIANSKLVSMKKKLKVSQQRTRHLKTSDQSLKSVVQSLKDKNLISSGCEEILRESFSGTSLAIMERLASGKKSFKGVEYPKELRSFAMTLQFYSAKAYEFVRKTFNLALPHQSHIRKWYSRVPAEPGFTEPAFDALRASVQAASEKGQDVVCSLMLDEMAIRKHSEWDGNSIVVL